MQFLDYRTKRLGTKTVLFTVINYQSSLEHLGFHKPKNGINESYYSRD